MSEKCYQEIEDNFFVLLGNNCSS